MGVRLTTRHGARMTLSGFLIGGIATMCPPAADAADGAPSVHTSWCGADRFGPVSRCVTGPAGATGLPSAGPAAEPADPAPGALPRLAATLSLLLAAAVPFASAAGARRLRRASPTRAGELPSWVRLPEQDPPVRLRDDLRGAAPALRAPVPERADQLVAR